MRVMKPLSWRMRASLQIRAMRCDHRGVSAIEFALIVPLLILMYVGIAEMGNLLTVVRRVETMSSTAADLTAQVKQVSNPDLADIFAASTSILDPYPTTPLQVVLSSVVADANNNGKVAWSCASKGSPRAVGSSYPLPANTTVANSSVIVAEITYQFTPLLGLTTIPSAGGSFNIGNTFKAMSLQRTFYERPRRSLTVAKTDSGCP
jgi:Flp pilus assembly protein TadG